MAKENAKKGEFETEEQKAESKATSSIVNQLQQQKQENIADNMNPPVAAEEPKAAGQDQTSIKTSDSEKKSNIKVDSSNPFNDILNIERKETKSHKANFLLTETNFQRLSKLSEETGASRNELINKLIESCYKNSGLS